MFRKYLRKKVNWLPDFIMLLAPCISINYLFKIVSTTCTYNDLKIHIKSFYIPEYFSLTASTILRESPPPRAKILLLWTSCFLTHTHSDSLRILQRTRRAQLRGLKAIELRRDLGFCSRHFLSIWHYSKYTIIII